MSRRLSSALLALIVSGSVAGFPGCSKRSEAPAEPSERPNAPRPAAEPAGAETPLAAPTASDVVPAPPASAQAAPAPASEECMQSCLRQNQARAEPIEKIEASCRAQCRN